MTKPPTPKQWGGRRQGAGRKPLHSSPTVTVSLRLPLDVRDNLQTLLKERGITVAVFIEESLKKFK